MPCTAYLATQPPLSSVMGRRDGLPWCYARLVITLQYVLVTVSWNGFPFYWLHKIYCLVFHGWLACFCRLQFSVLQDQGRFGKKRTIVQFVLYIYIHTCTAKKYPFYGIFTNPVLLLIIAPSFYCSKHIYTNLVNKLVHACKSSVFHHCTSCDLVLGRRSKADISQVPNPKLSECILNNWIAHCSACINPCGNLGYSYWKVELKN